MPLDSEKNFKNQEKEGKIGKNQEIWRKRGKIRKYRKKEEKSGRKCQNREGSFTLPLLTNRAGYATYWLHLKINNFLKNELCIS